MKKYHYVALSCIAAITLAIMYFSTVSRKNDCHAELANEEAINQRLEEFRKRLEGRKMPELPPIPEKYKTVTEEELNQRLEELRKDEFSLKIWGLYT